LPVDPGDTTAVTGNDSILTTLGLGVVMDRYSAEVWARGNTAYTTTWGTRGPRNGNAVKIWDVSGNTPELVDSIIVAGAGTLGDVQTSDDGSLLAVAIEYSPNGGLALFSLTDPRKPQLITRFNAGGLSRGVHTAEISRVNGKLYAFCAIDPTSFIDAQLIIVDITDPTTPQIVSTMTIGNPFIHDVFVRDGLLFAGEWNNGLAIYDIGAQGGSPANPQFISRVHTVGGQVHNIWWFHDPSNNSKKYVFVGEEGPAAFGSSSQGDIHVVDISDIQQPKEVAFYHVTGAGTHNFSMDETNGFLYAAYYNGGLRVLDVRGDLGTCDVEFKLADGRCQLHLIDGRLKARQKASFPLYTWGVQYVGNAVYASDMLNGIFKFAPVTR
jgi:hypothetical protein